MGDVKLSTLPAAVVASVKAAMVVAGFTELGEDPRVYTVDSLPNEPVEPYCVIELTDSGYGWDEGLDPGGSCGWPDLQVTGVGRMVQAARFVLDSVRSFLRGIDPTTVAVGGGTTIRLLSSSGPPTSPIEAGTLWNVHEIWNLYVEAS